MKKKSDPKYRKQSKPSGDLAFVELTGHRVYLGRYRLKAERSRHKARIEG
jgi:hypothetical protein